MCVTRSSFKKLRFAAFSPNAIQRDIDRFAKWFEKFGDVFWNGNGFVVDSSHLLFPVWNFEDGEYKIDHWEIDCEVRL